jgi:hypothetical protein
VLVDRWRPGAVAAGHYRPFRSESPADGAVSSAGIEVGSVAPLPKRLFTRREGGDDLISDCVCVGLVGVRVPRPEESPQTVSSTSRHDMNVEVRDALADLVVDGDKGSRCLHRGAYGNRYRSDRLEQRPDRWTRQLFDRLMMEAGDDEHVPREERSVIEECDGGVVLGDDQRVSVAAGYLAERARVHLLTLPGAPLRILCRNPRLPYHPE